MVCDFRCRSPLTEGRGLKHIVVIFDKQCEMSPLTEGRGLKRNIAQIARGFPHVAPHGGAWIETTNGAGTLSPERSPLTEGRGLKQSPPPVPAPRRASPLTEGRGLKQAIEERMQREQASPLTKECGNDV